MDVQRKLYRLWDAEQNCHRAVSPREALPDDDLVFFLSDLIPQIDLTPLHNQYARELRGQPPFEVTIMVTLLVYAYSVGLCSSRKFAAACERNLAFRVIVGDDPPDFRTISDFRKIHAAGFRPLFLEVLRLAGELGMVKLGNLSTDGTKMQAHASPFRGAGRSCFSDRDWIVRRTRGGTTGRRKGIKRWTQSGMTPDHRGPRRSDGRGGDQRSQISRSRPARRRPVRGGGAGTPHLLAASRRGVGCPPGGPRSCRLTRTPGVIPSLDQGVLPGRLVDEKPESSEGTDENIQIALFRRNPWPPSQPNENP